MNPNPRLFSCVGGKSGPWQTIETTAVAGDPLPPVERLLIVPGPLPQPIDSAEWILRGVTSNERYVTRTEKEQLLAKQQPLGRPEADRAVLIPIRKKAEWWALTQEDRRRIFEERSRHTEIGLQSLPAVARRLHHCRDLAEQELFDFLTWFEFSHADTAVFDNLLAQLRASEEWQFVDREVEIRFQREPAR